MGASDIHIEPYPGKDKVLVRFRSDGSLAKYIEVPASYRNAMVARLKIMCDLDIAERRKPQDGKIKFKKFGPLDIELRVATLPTTGWTRRRRDAHPGRRRADSARQAGCVCRPT
jgi:type II secretory ATPase GspE/PulE/Tfp pilus assembly ATPase PilB-like protein